MSRAFVIALMVPFSITLERNRNMGFMVLLTFFALLGCLIYLYAG